mmetsp:Transcript_21479/g.60824  ORF Transcript_21479/g.60824 Transcript_21479/m.60824 type:complete len:327 (+) Transcript_21479:204-1184(+)
MRPVDALGSVPVLIVLVEVHQDHGDVVHHRAALLGDPPVPGLLCKLLRCGHGLFWLVLRYQFDRLFRADELPHAIAAHKEHVVFGLDLHLLHLRLRRDAAVLMAHEVAEAAGHVQARVARALRVNAVVRISVKDHSSPVFLDARPLVLQVWLVVASQLYCLHCFDVPLLAFGELAQHHRAVRDVRDRQLLLVVVVDDEGRSRSRHLGAKLFHAVSCAHESLHLLEAVHEHGGHIGCLEALVLDDEFGQVILDKVGDVVSLLAVPVEHGVHREAVVNLEHEPRVLVGALRLQALPASVSQAVGRCVKFLTVGLHGFRCKGGLPVVLR